MEQEIEEALEAGVDVAPVSREYLMKARGVREHDYRDLGMHATETIDYAVVISGEAWMELDGGETVHLQAGDCLVQSGTAHNWYNKGDRVAGSAKNQGVKGQMMGRKMATRMARMTLSQTPTRV